MTSVNIVKLKPTGTIKYYIEVSPKNQILKGQKRQVDYKSNTKSSEENILPARSPFL